MEKEIADLIGRCGTNERLTSQVTKLKKLLRVVKFEDESKIRPAFEAISREVDVILGGGDGGQGGGYNPRIQKGAVEVRTVLKLAPRSPGDTTAKSTTKDAPKKETSAGDEKLQAQRDELSRRLDVTVPNIRLARSKKSPNAACEKLQSRIGEVVLRLNSVGKPPDAEETARSLKDCDIADALIAELDKALLAAAVEQLGARIAALRPPPGLGQTEAGRIQASIDKLAKRLGKASTSEALEGLEADYDKTADLIVRIGEAVKRGTGKGGGSGTPQDGGDKGDKSGDTSGGKGEAGKKGGDGGSGGTGKTPSGDGGGTSPSPSGSGDGGDGEPPKGDGKGAHEKEAVAKPKATPPNTPEGVLQSLGQKLKKEEGPRLLKLEKQSPALFGKLVKLVEVRPDKVLPFLDCAWAEANHVKAEIETNEGICKDAENDIALYGEGRGALLWGKPGTAIAGLTEASTPKKSVVVEHCNTKVEQAKAQKKAAEAKLKELRPKLGPALEQLREALCVEQVSCISQCPLLLEPPKALQPVCEGLVSLLDTVTGTELISVAHAELGIKEAEKAYEAARQTREDAVTEVKRLQEAYKPVLKTREDALATVNSFKQAGAARDKAMVEFQAAEKRRTEAKAEIDEARREYDATEERKTEAQAGIDEAKKTLKKARTAKAALQIVEELTYGCLAGDKLGGLPPKQVAELLSLVPEHPEVCLHALTGMSHGADPDCMLAGIRCVGPLFEGGFASEPKEDRTYDHWTDQADKIARNAFALGGKRGPGYFEGMAKYYADDTHGKPQLLKPEDDKAKWGSKEQCMAYTEAMGSAMIDETGKLISNPKEAKPLMDCLLYHPMMLQGPLFNLIDNMEDFQKLCAERSADITKVLQTEQSLPSGKGKKPDAKNKQSVITAMLTPFNQSQVGSCFATGPALKLRTEEPLVVMQDLMMVECTGRLQKGRADPMACVMGKKLPEAENELLRSWEYTCATIGARRENSAQKKKLGSALFGKFTKQDGKGESLEYLSQFFPGEWETQKKTIRGKIAECFTFSYDPSVDIKDSSDGTSSKGSFVCMFRNGDKEKPITDASQFCTLLGDVIKQTVKKDEDGKIAEGIAGLMRSQQFRTCLISGYSKNDKQDFGPWKISGGGNSKDPLEILYETEINPAKVLGKAEKGEKKGTRCLALLDSFAKQPPAGMIPIGTGEIHDFNLLSEHEDIVKLRKSSVEELLLNPVKGLEKELLPARKCALLMRGALRSVMSCSADIEPVLAQLSSKDMTLADLKESFFELSKPFFEPKAREANAGKAVDLDEKTKAMAAKCFDTEMMASFDVPCICFADTNWGSADDFTEMVVAVDPCTGEPALWKRTQPLGTFERLEDKWIEAKWERSDVPPKEKR